MFLFIFESIGTSELILIAIVALIVFGPRKLPQMAKTIGKTMAEFRNATNEFKSTWEKEVAFETEEKKVVTLPDSENQIAREPEIISTNEIQTESETSFPTPTIKELSASDIAEKFHNKDIPEQTSKIEERNIEKTVSNKRDWL